ncbi:MAG: YihY/virulence factor BrkB family protein [Methylococcaceae bacterium]|nr:YihY/virulence factor BrkB family protein [Methylococcaceae bacterium]
MTSSITKYIKEDVWLVSENKLSPLNHIVVKTLKILLLSVQGFKSDLCQLRASALTLYTLLSIVPVIALLFGIAKGFGFEKKLEQQLLEQASEQDSMMLQLIEFSQNMLSSTKGGVVAGIGIVVLFWTVIKVIGNIEESFNHIWKIKKNRPMARKLSDYLSLMMLAPVLLIASSSLTVFVKTQITWLVEVIHLPTFGTKVVLYTLNYSPLVIMSLLFTFIFLFMPNQKIAIKAGVIAGVATGIMYQIVQWAYLTLQIGASSYNAIYGSFAALPLFLVWLQLGWVVVLFGCEISFFVHNFESYRHNEKFSNLSFSLKKNIALQVCHNIVMRFAAGEKASNAEQISRELALPVSVVQNSLSALIDSSLIVELKVLEEEDIVYQPAQDINNLTVKSVINALEINGLNIVPGMKGYEQFSRLNVMVDNVLIKDI